MGRSSSFLSLTSLADLYYHGYKITIYCRKVVISEAVAEEVRSRGLLSDIM